MPCAQIDFDAMRSIRLFLPNVEEGTEYGSPAMKLREKLVTCIPVHRFDG